MFGLDGEYEDSVRSVLLACVIVPVQRWGAKLSQRQHNSTSFIYSEGAASQRKFEWQHWLNVQQSSNYIIMSSSASAAATTSAATAASQQEALSRMSKMVAQFMARPDAVPFNEPVDWKALDLYDYPEIIPNPQDFGTIQRRLEQQKYQYAAEVAHDLRLVWSNCMTYNAENSDFWILAKQFSKRFEDRYRRIRNECTL